MIRFLDQVGMSDVGLEKETLESRKQTVHSHTSWSLKLPSKGVVGLMM